MRKKEIQEIDLLGLLRERTIEVELENGRNIYIFTEKNKLTAELWEMKQDGADDVVWNFSNKLKINIQ